MNKRFLFAAALCAAMNLSAFAQTNLTKGIVPEKIGPILTGSSVPETLAGLTDGDFNGDVHLEGKNGGVMLSSHFR